MGVDEEELIRLRAANAALQEQLRELLRQMASRQHQEQLEPAAPSSARIGEGSSFPGQPRAAVPSHEALTALQALVAPLFAENGRLVDTVRNQAEQLGALAERLRYLEKEDPQSHSAAAHCGKEDPLSRSAAPHCGGAAAAPHPARAIPCALQSDPAEVGSSGS